MRILLPVLIASLAFINSTVLSISGANAAEFDATTARKLHPTDTVLYVEYDGRDKHLEAVQATAAYVAFHESGLEALEIPCLDFIQEKIDNQEGAEDAADLFRGFREALEHAARDGFSSSLAIPKDGLPLPRMTIVLHESGHLVDSWTTYLMEMVNKYPELFDNSDVVQEFVDNRDVTRITVKGDVNAEFAVWKEGNHALLTFGLGASKWALAVANSKMENLMQNPTFADALTMEPDFEVISRSVIDIPMILKKYEGFAIPTDSGEPLTVGDIFKITGLNKLGLMTCQSGYKEAAIWTETRLVCKELGKYNRSVFEMSDLPPLPWDCTTACAFDIDASDCFKSLKKMIESAIQFAPPREREQAFQILDQLDEIVGFNIEKDLLETIGDLACFYNDPDGGSYGVGFGFAFKLADSEKFSETLDIIQTKLIELDDFPFFIVETEKLDRKILLSEFYIDDASVQYGALGIDDQWAILGLMPQAVTGFFHRLDGSIVSWEPTEELQECLDEMPTAFHQIGFNDARATTRLAYNWLLFISPFIQSSIYNSGFLEGEETLPFHVEDLPPAELIIDPLFPTVSTCTSDGDTIIWTNRSATGIFGLLGLY